MPRTRRRRAIAAAVAVVLVAAAAIAGGVLYGDTWAGTDATMDALGLSRLGTVAHREHNDWLNPDIAPNTTCDLRPRAGATADELRRRVVAALRRAGWRSDAGPDDGYQQWTPAPGSAAADRGAFLTISTPQVGSLVGSDTNPPHRITAPTLRFAVS